MDKDKIQRMTTHKGIKWKFNPPGGSHFGGVHEIMFEAAIEEGNICCSEKQ